jgi:hypothetical protein
MAQGAANVTSVDAVKALKGTLQRFAEEVQNALVQLDIESRRAQEWIEHDRARYWSAEERKAATVVSEAKLSLERAELNTDGETRYCYEERKLLEKAKRRQRLTEEKVQAVRQWKLEIQQELEAFQVQLAKLQHYLEGDYTKGVAALDRIGAALDRYVQRQSASGSSSAPSASNATGGGAP